MTETAREVRSVLLGKTLPMENGQIRSMTEDDFALVAGYSDGAAAVRVLGMTRRSRVLETAMKERELLRLADRCMRKAGRSLLLVGEPDTPACLIRYILTKPCVLTFRYVDKKPVVTAWAGRSLTGWISTSRAIAAFERTLPEGVRYAEDEAPDEEKEERQAKKAAKAAKKAAKTEEKAKKAEEKAKRAEEKAEEKAKKAELKAAAAGAVAQVAGKRAERAAKEAQEKAGN